MGEYVVVHFDSEEEIQKKYNYSRYKEHFKTHEKFKDYVSNFKEKFEKGECDKDMIMEFSGRLLTWLISHVADDDQKIGDHIKEVT
jgi:hemerythrin